MFWSQILGALAVAVLTPIAAALAVYELVLIVIRYRSDKAGPGVQLALQEVWNG